MISKVGSCKTMSFWGIKRAFYPLIPNKFTRPFAFQEWKNQQDIKTNCLTTKQFASLIRWHYKHEWFTPYKRVAWTQNVKQKGLKKWWPSEYDHSDYRNTYICTCIYIYIYLFDYMMCVKRNMIQLKKEVGGSRKKEKLVRTLNGPFPWKDTPRSTS